MVRPQPRRRGNRVARSRRRRGRRRGRDELLPTLLDGVETRLAIPVNVATDARYRGQGVFSTLEEANEAAAAASGSPLTVTFPNASSHPIFVRRLGWTDLPRLRLWARPLRFSGVVRYALGRAGRAPGHARFDRRAPPPARARGAPDRALRRGHGRARPAGRAPGTAATSCATPSTSTGATSTPRATTAASARIAGASSRAWRSSATRSSTASRPASSPTSSRRPEDSTAVRALVSRAVDEVEGGADALVLLPPREPRSGARSLRAGFAPTNKKLRFIGKALHDGVRIDESRRRMALHARRLRLLLSECEASSSSPSRSTPRIPRSAATVPKIAALAALVDEVVVLADGAVRGVLPANCRVRTFRARPQGACAALASRRRSRASSGSPRRRGGRAHVPDLRGPRGTARPAAPHPARPLVHALACVAGCSKLAERASTAVASVDERSFPLPSRKLRAIGHGIDLAEFPCSPPRVGDGLRLLALGRYSTAKGLDVVVRRRAARRRRRRAGRARPGRSPTRNERTEPSSSSSWRELGLGGRVTIGDAVPRTEIPAALRRHDALVNNMRAGAPDKVVYEAAAAVPARARVEPDLRRAPRLRAALHPLGPGRAGRADSRRSRRSTRTSARRSAGDFASASRRRHSVQSWARGILDAAGISLTDGLVLHMQKVAGISGSEAHLLQLLPDLRERGWDVRFLMLHEDEPGAWEFAEALAREGRAARRHPAASRRRPDRVRRGRRVSRAHAAAHPPHAPRARGRLRPARRATARVSRFGSPRSTASTSFARDGGSASRTDPSARSRTSTSRSPRGSRSTSRRPRASTSEDFEIVHYGIDSEGAAAPYVGAEPRLVCVGRLIPIKGHLVLLRALAQARARGSEPHARRRRPRAAGSLRCRPTRASSVSRRRCGSSGSSSPVSRAFEDAAIAVVPSLGEGFGMVALEAMERARPVIASAVGGLPEIVADGETGLVVPPADAEALADAIVALAGDLLARQRWARRAASARSGSSRRSGAWSGRRSSTRERWSPRRCSSAAAAVARAPTPTRAQRRRGARGGSPTARGTGPCPAKTIAASVL